MKKIRVAAYARVSTDSDDQANSLESQIRFFTAEINKNPDWELVKVYADEGISGTQTQKRQGFRDMISDAMEGKLDYIITKEVSRFARNVLDSIRYTRMLQEIGVSIKFVLDGIDTSQPDAELRLTIMAALAQEESRKTSERVKWGQQRQMEKGVVFGRSLLGYRVEGGKLHLVEEEAEIVRLIFHKYLVEGKGTQMIAKELKQAGIRPCDPDGRAKYKNDWSSTVILRLLRNEKYVGDLAQKKTYTKSYLDHKKRCNRGQEDIVYIKDHHPEIAIIDRVTWEATQAELSRRSTSKQQQTTRYSNRYWASGKIFCGICGERFVSKTKKNSVGSTRAWNCANHVKAAAFRKAECSKSAWASDKSLKYVVAYLLNLLVQDKQVIKNEILAEICSEISTGGYSSMATTLKKKIEAAQSKKIRLLDLRLSNEISPEEFRMQRRHLDDEMLALQRHMDRLAQEYPTTETRLQPIAEVVERILAFNESIGDAVACQVIKRIVVFPGHIIEVSFWELPMTFRVSYRSTGKLDAYKTEILHCEIV